MGCGAHLTVYLAQSIKADHVDDHGHKRGHARQ
jgi:hypothetical protein